jgi:CheY-like chemotaxis protein
MAMLIKMMGHDVQFAINGFAAIAVARKFHPHIILLDIGLPDFKGHIIAQQLKFDPRLEKVRIIAITGLPGDDRLEQSVLEAGCDGFYRKPIEPAKLEELLAKPSA